MIYRDPDEDPCEPPIGLLLNRWGSTYWGSIPRDITSHHRNHNQVIPGWNWVKSSFFLGGQIYDMKKNIIDRAKSEISSDFQICGDFIRRSFDWFGEWVMLEKSIFKAPHVETVTASGCMMAWWQVVILGTVDEGSNLAPLKRWYTEPYKSWGKWINHLSTINTFLSSTEIVWSCNLLLVRIRSLQQFMAIVKWLKSTRAKFCHPRIAIHMSSDQHPDYLLYRGDITTQSYGYWKSSHYKNPY